MLEIKSNETNARKQTNLCKITGQNEFGVGVEIWDSAILILKSVPGFESLATKAIKTISINANGTRGKWARV